MFIKKTFVNLLRIFLILFLFLSANAQIQTLGEFKEVKISFNLKLEDSVVEKGKYDFEFLRHGKDVFYLRIRKEGNIICIIPGGEKVKYKNQGNLALMSTDPDIPEKKD